MVRRRGVARREVAGVVAVAECQRCGQDTERRTLVDEPLCAECVEWIEEHEETRDAGQKGLGAFEE